MSDIHRIHLFYLFSERICLIVIYSFSRWGGGVETYRGIVFGHVHLSKSTIGLAQSIDCAIPLGLGVSTKDFHSIFLVVLYAGLLRA